jgi:hypothetical protein
MLGDIVEPKAPFLTVDLPLNGIAVLVQSFEIAEDASDLVAGRPEVVATLSVIIWRDNFAVTACRSDQGTCVSHEGFRSFVI